MLFSLLQLIVVCYLPGALLFRLPLSRRHRRAALGPDERLFWAVVISVAGSSIAGFALAASGLFTLGRLVSIDLVAGLLIAAIWRRDLGYGGTAARAGWTALIPVALVVLGVLLFFPPAEHVIGGKDPGVYINEGIQIAQRGSLVIHDTLVAAVPARVRDLFFPPYGQSEYYSLRFMGFFVLDPVRGTVIGQLPHLYPLWIAVGYGLAGVRGALATTGCWAVLALLAVYFTGRRLVGTAGAAAAAGLLGLCVIQVWFAREPNAEVLTEPLLLAALLAYARAHVDRDAFFGALAGTLIGLLLFVRGIDGLLPVAGAGLALVLQLLDRRRPQVAFLVPLATLGLLDWLYLTRVMPAYSARLFVFLQNLRPGHVALLAAGAALLVLVALAARRPVLARRLHAAVPYGFIAVITGGAIYAWFFRHPSGPLAWHDAMSLRTFAWYVPPAALAAAVAGYALVTWRSCWNNLAWIATTAVYALFVFYKIQVVPQHFWMTRRFVPLILPATMLMIGGLAFVRAARVRKEPRPAVSGAGGFQRFDLVRLVIPAVFLVLVGTSLARASRPVLAHVEYAGVLPRLEALAARFTAGDLILVESRSASDLHVLALPLAYTFGRQVLVLNTQKPDKLMVREFLRWAEAHYRAVYFIGGGGTDLLSRSITVTPVASERFQVPEYDSPLNAYPRGVRRKEFDFGIYRFERPAPPGAAPAPAGLDVGRLDDLNVWRFHAKEPMGDVTFRWTRDVSYLSLTGLTAEARTLTLRLSNGGRPASVPPADVTVYLDDRLLGAVRVTNGFHPYAFAIPPDLARAAAGRDDPAVLKLVSTTWNPHDALGTPDDRQLGVMLDRVDVQ